MRTKWPVVSKVAISILIAIFCIAKIPFLFTPYFWDEAWSYIPAVSAMAKSFPCLLPGCIDPELYRGHPLFFYFLSSVWMKFVSASSFSMHLLALLVSVLTLISFYALARQFLKEIFALGAVFLLMLQEIFFVQASFLLAEVMLVLFTMQAVRYIMLEKYFLFFIYGSLLGLTKETGLIILGIIILMDQFLKKHLTSDRLWIYASTLPAILFYIMQKVKLGWFLYPLHTDMVSFSLNVMVDKVLLMLRFIFFEQGRIWLLIVMACCLLYQVFKTKSRSYLLYVALGVILTIGSYFVSHLLFFGVVLGGIYLSMVFIFSFSSKEIRMLQIAATLSLSVLVFSAANFLMLRYILVIFPLLILIAFIIIQNSLIARQWGYRLILILLSLGFIQSMYSHYTKRGWHDDVTINYHNAVKSHQSAIAFCESNQWYNKVINTHFLLQQNLLFPELGYLIEGRPFEHVTYDGNVTEDTELVIFSCIELDENKYEMVKRNPAFKLVYKNSRHQAWTEIYATDQTLDLVKVEL